MCAHFSDSAYPPTQGYYGSPYPSLNPNNDKYNLNQPFVTPLDKQRMNERFKNYNVLTPTMQTSYLPNVNSQFISNAAMHYGSEAIDQSKIIIGQKMETFMGLSRLKHFFNVDNTYVAGRLFIILFPFLHKDWSRKYDSSGVLPPRNDMNSPDLYIPAMSLLTYILLASMSLGLCNKFSPELLGILASQALGWLIFETCLLNLSFYILNIRTNLTFLDLLAYGGYKFVHMDFVLISAMLIFKTGYYIAIAWTGLAFAFFMIRSLKFQIQPQHDVQMSWNPRSSIYMLLFIALVQPLVIWWLTSSVAFVTKE